MMDDLGFDVLMIVEVLLIDTLSLNDVPFHTQEDRRHKTTTNKKSVC